MKDRMEIVIEKKGFKLEFKMFDKKNSSKLKFKNLNLWAKVLPKTAPRPPPHGPKRERGGEREREREEERG